MRLGPMPSCQGVGHTGQFKAQGPSWVWWHFSDPCIMWLAVYKLIVSGFICQLGPATCVKNIDNIITNIVVASNYYRRFFGNGLRWLIYY